MGKRYCSQVDSQNGIQEKEKKETTRFWKGNSFAITTSRHQTLFFKNSDILSLSLLSQDKKLQKENNRSRYITWRVRSLRPGNIMQETRWNRQQQTTFIWWEDERKDSNDLLLPKPLSNVDDERFWWYYREEDAYRNLKKKKKVRTRKLYDIYTVYYVFPFSVNSIIYFRCFFSFIWWFSFQSLAHW
jgi:hypothetical protein